MHAVAQFELAENQSRAAEGVRLHDVAAHAEEVGMDVANNVGTAEHQNFAAVLLAPVIVEGRIALLDVRAHSAVVNHDAFFTSWRKSVISRLVVRRWSLVVRSLFAHQSANDHESRPRQLLYNNAGPAGPAFGGNLEIP